MSDLLQQIVVGVVALGAAAVVLRRVTALFRKPKAAEVCEHCAVADLAESVDQRPDPERTPTSRHA